MGYVNEENETRQDPQKPLSTLTCMGMGFEIVARHLELLIVPIVLDLLLWLGPRLSVAPLLNSANFRASLAALETTTAEMQQGVILLQQIFTELGTRFNLAVMMQPFPLEWPPSLMSSTYMSLKCAMGACPDIVSYPELVRPEILITSPWAVGGVSFLLMLVGLGFNAVYLRAIGFRVIEETEVALPGPVNPLWLCWRLLKLLALVLMLFFALGNVVFFLAGCASLLHPFLSKMMNAIFFSLVTFILLHLIFAIPGIVQRQIQPLQAVRESVMLTRGDFLNVLLLVVLVLVVWQGLNYVWSRPDPRTWQMWIGIGGHAFVSTALTATIFVFYQDRLRFLEMFLKTLAAREAAAHPIAGK
ncbi:MAG TPA: hypothetical protein PKH77_02770 [Anaerolineae bacterium]|nr:hypothetical protein [Anaerolineae bacterium]